MPEGMDFRREESDDPRGKTKTQDMPDSMTGAWHCEHDHRRLPVVDRPPRWTDRWFVVL